MFSLDFFRRNRQSAKSGRYFSMSFKVLCRLERESTGSWLDVEIEIRVIDDLEGILSMVYPGWELVSFCPG